MQHIFDVDIATEYGILEAILIKNFYYWIIKNKANNTNYYDGCYWTYNSIKALKELFPYVSERQISKALKHLEEEKIIKIGNYNKSAYDRTCWYAFDKSATSILQKCKMEVTKMQNGFDKSAEPIPNIKTNINTNNNIKEIVDYLNARLGTNYKYTTKQTQSMINARLKEGFTVEDFKKVIDKKYKEWRGTEFEQYLTPQTLFGTKFEKYLNQKTTKEVDPYAGVPRL